MGNEDAASDVPWKEKKYAGNYSARFTGRKLVSDIIVVIKRARTTKVEPKNTGPRTHTVADDPIMATGNATRTQYSVSVRSSRYPTGCSNNNIVTALVLRRRLADERNENGSPNTPSNTTESPRK